MPSTDDSSRTFSAATDRVLNVMEVLSSEPDSMTLTSLAKKTGMPIATCAAIMYTLESRGYAHRTAVGRSHFWQLTLSLYGVASQQVQKLNYADIAQSDLRTLAGTLGLPAHVGVLSGSKLVYVAKEAGSSFIQFDTFPGKAVPFNLTALGRAVAAHLPDDQLDYLSAHLEMGKGPNATQPTEQSFREDLENVRRTGFAFEDEEEVSGVSCAAAAFFDSSGAVAGAVGVTAISDVMVEPFKSTVVAALHDAADSISVKLGARVPTRRG
jgi:IclR family KDG regulon transcriptional repressor